MKKTILALAASVLFLACSKNDNKTPEAPAVKNRSMARTTTGTIDSADAEKMARSYYLSVADAEGVAQAPLSFGVTLAELNQYADNNSQITGFRFYTVHNIEWANNNYGQSTTQTTTIMVPVNDSGEAVADAYWPTIPCPSANCLIHHGLCNTAWIVGLLVKKPH